MITTNNDLTGLMRSPDAVNQSSAYPGLMRSPDAVNQSSAYPGLMRSPDAVNQSSAYPGLMRSPDAVNQSSAYPGLMRSPDAVNQSSAYPGLMRSPDAVNQSSAYPGLMKAQRFTQPCFTPHLPTENVALRGKATQSALPTGPGAVLSLAAYAIDGNRDSDAAHGSCAHTTIGPGAWWRVDLLKPYFIASVTITNRGDCCGERISGAQILIGDSLENNGINNPLPVPIFTLLKCLVIFIM